MILCGHCGHRAKHHTGVGAHGYTNGTRLACRFETDRYEVCTCDALELDHADALAAAIELDDQED